MINHKSMSWIVAIAVGVALALVVFQRSTDPEPTRQKVKQEGIVAEARLILTSYVAPGHDLHLVDPLSPNSKIGKSYIWPADSGWEVSGYYRRDKDDLWHPYLMKLDNDYKLVSLAVQDANERLIGMSAQDPKFSALP